jgi:Glycine zipper 2TM domain
MKKTFTLMTIVTAVALLFAACKNGTSTTPVSNQDTVGFAQFQQMKLQQEQEAAFAAMYAKSMATNNTVARKSSTTSGTMSSSSTNNAKVEKKGMSKSAKYAIIGGTGGAVLGAVINKRNRVAGGVIGGVLGGGLGYGIGRSQDKKDGRIE